MREAVLHEPYTTAAYGLYKSRPSGVPVFGRGRGQPPPHMYRRPLPHSFSCTHLLDITDI